jgi:hypothetical protein
VKSSSARVFLPMLLLCLVGLAATAAAETRFGLGGSLDESGVASVTPQLSFGSMLVQGRLGYESFSSGGVAVGSFDMGLRLYGRILGSDDGTSFLAGGGVSFLVGEPGISAGNIDAGGSGTTTTLSALLGVEHNVSSSFSVSAFVAPRFSLDYVIADFRGTLLTLGWELQFAFYF